MITRWLPGTTAAHYLLRRWLLATAVITVVLLAVLLLIALADAAAEAAAGRLPPGLIAWQAALSLPESLLVTLPMAALGGLLHSLLALAEDRELLVLRGLGFSYARLTGVAAAGGLLLAAIQLLITGFLQPAAVRGGDDLRRAALNSAKVWGLEAGRFVRLPGMDAVAYVASISDDGTGLGELFIHTRQAGVETVLTATGGVYRQDAGGRGRVALFDGQRTELPDDGLAVRNVTFASGELLLPPPAALPAAGDSVERSDLPALWRRGAEERQEFHWRLAPPQAIFILTLIGLPLAVWGQGTGRGRRFAGALVVYLLYLQLLASARPGAALDDQLGAWLPWLHVPFLLVALGAGWLAARRF